MREGWVFSLAGFPGPLWRAYVELEVQVGAIFVANQKCALCCF